MTTDDPWSLSLAEVADRCAHQTALFFRRLPSDPRYCFDLFRRAIAGRSSPAWHLLYTQYSPLVAGWVQRHPAFAACSEDVQCYVNVAFEKMWAALSPDRFRQFPDLPAILRYLQMCAHSAIQDEVRRAHSTPAGLEPETVADPGGGPGVEASALDAVQRQALWREVSDRLKDDKERAVVYGSFVLALKPRELCAQFPGTFSGVAEVYRIKENVLDRLRRDAGLRQFAGADA